MIVKSIRISRNSDLYGCVHSILAYRENREIGRAMFGIYPTHHWLIGPSGIPRSEDFELTLNVNPAWTQEQTLAKVETLLRLSISAAEAGSRRAA